MKIIWGHSEATNQGVNRSIVSMILPTSFTIFFIDSAFRQKPTIFGYFLRKILISGESFTERFLKTKKLNVLQERNDRVGKEEHRCSPLKVLLHKLLPFIEFRFLSCCLQFVRKTSKTLLHSVWFQLQPYFWYLNYFSAMWSFFSATWLPKIFWQDMTASWYHCFLQHGKP